MNENIGYRKEYKIRRAINGKDSLEVTIPYEVIDKLARQESISVEEYMDTHIAIAEYNGFEGVRYTFKKVINGNLNK